MNRRHLLTSLLPAIAMSLLGRPVPAAEPPKAERYRLYRSRVAGAEPRKWVFVVVPPPGGDPTVVAPARLAWAVENVVPKGATLEWSPGCLRIGGEPLNTPEELDALKAACRRRGVEFVQVMAG